MLTVSEKASQELTKALSAETAKDKHLIIVFQGMG